MASRKKSSPKITTTVSDELDLNNRPPFTPYGPQNEEEDEEAAERITRALPALLKLTRSYRGVDHPLSSTSPFKDEIVRLLGPEDAFKLMSGFDWLAANRARAREMADRLLAECEREPLTSDDISGNVEAYEQRESPDQQWNARREQILDVVWKHHPCAVGMKRLSALVHIPVKDLIPLVRRAFYEGKLSILSDGRRRPARDPDRLININTVVIIPPRS